MGIYPFSLAVYFPSLDSEDNIGRIPLYVKVVPRGEISSSLSDISSLELFTVNKLKSYLIILFIIIIFFY